jgi:hypothetical protein
MFLFIHSLFQVGYKVAYILFSVNATHFCHILSWLVHYVGRLLAKGVELILTQFSIHEHKSQIITFP